VADARGQHNDRDRTALADLAQDFEAVEHGEHHVQDDEIVGAFESARQAGAATHGVDLKVHAA
jgi:hypothetical protein